MKKNFILLLLLFPLGLAAQSNCSVSTEKPIKLLSDELKRGFKTFQKQHPPVYYLSYTLLENNEESVNATNGGVESEQRGYNRLGLSVMVRVGNPKMDNTRTLKKGYGTHYVTTAQLPQIEGNGKAFTTGVWTATQHAIEEAQQAYSQVQTEVQTASDRSDDSPDFVFPSKETFCQTQDFTRFDFDQIKNMLAKASTLVQGKSFIFSSDFYFSNNFGYNYFVDSVGTRIKTPFQYVRLGYEVSSQTRDGLILRRTHLYDVSLPEQLPSPEQLAADVEQSMQELEQQLNAPEAEPVTVPAILKNRAMAVFVHEVLGHRAEGHRQKEDDFGKTFTDKIGQEIVSPLLTVVDDSTLASFNGEPLRGFYLYDSEGVKARPVMLVENGIFKNFLMSLSPIKGFNTSNGHGRSAFGFRPVSRMGNTRVIASETIPYEELEKKLIEEVKKQGKPYGIIIEDLAGGFTMTETFFPQAFKLEPTFMYRLYPDGRKELVRGVDMVGTPLVSFKEVIAAADDYAVFNGSCGAESGWVPVSGIAPSVLLRSLELEKTQKSVLKQPILLPPSSEVKK